MLGPEAHGVGVFSAHAEVVPLRSPAAQQPTRILRVRGGSSGILRAAIPAPGYSPRTRR